MTRRRAPWGVQVAARFIVYGVLPGSILVALLGLVS